MLRNTTTAVLVMIASALPTAACLGAEDTGSKQPETRAMDIMGWDHKVDSPRDSANDTRDGHTPLKTGPAVIKQPADHATDQVGKFREPTKHVAH